MGVSPGGEPGTGPGPRDGRGRRELLRRATGAALVVLSLAPLPLLLEPDRIGPFGADVRARALVNMQFSWWGVVLALVLGAAVALLAPEGSIRRGARRVSGWLEAPSLPAFTAGVAVLAASLGLVVSRVIFDGLPTGVDEMASLLQARYLAEGALAGPVLDDPAPFLVVNTVLSPEGWTSLYPPAHLLVLAGGLALGAPWLAPPLLLATLAALTCVAAHRILGPERRGAARVGGALVALSPFLFFLGGSYLSHVSAAAFLAGALLAALAARDGHAGWSAAAGAAMGLAVTSRPWTGLLVGGGLTVGLWVATAPGRRGPRGWLLRRVGGWIAGGVPFAAAWLLYNDHFFGAPLRTGYTYAYGPAHGLGFHRDPWGNLYGLVEALGFTAADLAGLNVHLLETPIPAVALVGVWLATARRVPSGVAVLLTWALLPVAANVFYWHHGSHMGPRMLYEGAPAWVLLAVLAARGLVRRLSVAPGEGDPAGRETGTDADPDAPSGSPPPGRRPWSERISPAGLAASALLVALLAAPVLATGRGRTYAWEPDELRGLRVPAVPDDGPALIFVHGAWAERITARLQADGMRMDSVETALRRNDVCLLHRYALARAGSGGGADDPASSIRRRLDLRPLPGTPDRLRFVELSPGNRVRVDPGLAPTPGCRREARADRLGVTSLAPLLWQADLPGIEEGRPLVVRDLGPAANARLLERWPDRTPWVFLDPGDDGPPALVPYEEGMARLWGS